MTGIILDASALLALINQEKGGDLVKSVLPDASISAVNFAEVLGIMVARHNIPLQNAKEALDELIKAVIPFTKDQAHIMTEIDIINMKEKLNLSLADRACIATGIFCNLPIYTADKQWININMPNLDIRLIR